MSEEKTWLQTVDQRANQALLTSSAAIGGSIIGEALDSPVTEIQRRIKVSRENKMAGDNVTQFGNKRQNAENSRHRNIKKMHNKRLRPVFGAPKSKTALAGGIIGTGLAATLISYKNHPKPKDEFSESLAKEASENYRNILL